jgi:hypothetical protein
VVAWTEWSGFRRLNAVWGFVRMTEVPERPFDTPNTSRVNPRYQPIVAVASSLGGEAQQRPTTGQAS